MEKKRSGKKLEEFLAGKGFYIVLFLCAAIIGVSAWSLAAGGAKKEASIDSDTALSNSGVISGNYDYDDGDEAAAPVISATAEPEDPPEGAQTGTFTQNEVWNETDNVYVSPVAGQTQRAYSMDKLGYDQTMADWRTHDGVDIACEKGSAVKAAHSGTVESVKADELYGTVVTVDQGGGMKACYANLTATPAVKAGDTVTAGDVIGYVGNSAICESAQAAHLHFSMSLDGDSVDPGEYIP